MRAAGVSSYGGHLHEFEVPTPDLATLSEGQVLVNVAAAGIGSWDSSIASGVQGTDSPLPLVLGWEGSGVVAAVGPGVNHLAPGDRVLSYLREGAWYAEQVLVPATNLAIIPDGMGLLEAGALPVAGITAVQGLTEEVRLAEGETILIAGSAGGTGPLLVQLAHHLGARVIATAGPANLDYVRSIGADVVLDHTKGIPAILEAVRQLAPDGVDVLFDGVSGENFAALSEAVRVGGRAASITWPTPEVRSDIEARQIFSAATPERLAEVVRLAGEGVFVPVVRSTFALGSVAQAHEQLDTRRGRGKILLTPGSFEGQLPVTGT